MHYKTTDEALRSRIKAYTKGSLMSTPKLTKRYVVERVTDHFADVFGPSPMRLVGGLCNPQWSRETTDADIKCIRRFTEQEMLNGLSRMKEILRPEGIDIVHSSVQLVEIPGLREPVRRIKLDTVTGGMVANTHIDLRSDWGPNAWSKHFETKTFAPLFPNGPAYTATVECKESEVAAKWLAVLTQPETDLRTKSHWDLIYLCCSTGGVNRQLVAEEMDRLQQHRGLRYSDLVRRVDHVLGFKTLNAREANWNKLRAERHEKFCVEEGYMHLNVEWKKVEAHWMYLYRERAAALILERQTRMAYGLPRDPEPVVHTDNVVAFRR